MQIKMYRGSFKKFFEPIKLGGTWAIKNKNDICPVCPRDRAKGGKLQEQVVAKGITF